MKKKQTEIAGVKITQNNDDEISALKEKMIQLERTLYQKQIEVEFLTKMIDIAEETMNIDIRKKYNGL